MGLSKLKHPSKGTILGVDIPEMKRVLYHIFGESKIYKVWLKNRERTFVALIDESSDRNEIEKFKNSKAYIIQFLMVSSMEEANLI